MVNSLLLLIVSPPAPATSQRELARELLPGSTIATRRALKAATDYEIAATTLNNAFRRLSATHLSPFWDSNDNPGSAIVGDNGQQPRGIDIPETAALPFLLAARAQSVALDEKGPARPLFAYGIASSYEAFRRLGSDDSEEVRDSDIAAEDRDTVAPTQAIQTAISSDAVRWYRNEIDRALKDSDTRDAHPKVDATVTKATQLWVRG